MTALVARARGLGSTLLPAAVAAELERAPTFPAVHALLQRAGVAGDALDARALDRLARDRTAADLAVLDRWATGRAAAILDVLALDEDRRSIRSLVRAITAHVGVEHRATGTVATPRLGARVLAILARVATVPDLARELARRAHPLAPALVAPDAAGDPLVIELALARTFVALARRPRDPALAMYVTQLVDGENAAAALVLAGRASGVAPVTAFVTGGARVTSATYLAAAEASSDVARLRLGEALAGTPLAAALDDPAAAAFEEAVLAWQLAAQHALRRLAPLGAAPVIHLVLERRLEARRLRRTGWRLGFGGAR